MVSGFLRRLSSSWESGTTKVGLVDSTGGVSFSVGFAESAAESESSPSF